MITMSEDLRSEIEEVIDDRIVNKIEPRIEAQITSKLNKKIWVIASICITILLAVIGNIFYNNSQLVKTETILTEYIRYEKDAHDQLRKQIEKNSYKIENHEKEYSYKLNEISENQTIIIFGLKQINPKFNLNEYTRNGSVNKNVKMGS